jgi:predicted dehydrogenase
VYTEKPLTRTVHESRVLLELSRRHKVATSMGNQGTASPAFRRALELIREGALGVIREVHVWNDSGGGGFREAPAEQAKVPAYLNWDLWLGPARHRAFHPRWMNWHQWRDFGTGQLGNWASHTANLAFMALKVDSLWSSEANPKSTPVRIEAKVQEINPLSFPRWEMITWQVPARGELPAVPFYWHNGSGRPGMRDALEKLAGRGLDWGDKGEKKWADFAGSLIVGSEGAIHATGHNATFTLLPEEKWRELPRDQPQKLERSRGHERDWLAACAGGKAAWASFEYASPLNQFLQLGNVATQVEGPVEYDPIAGRIMNNARANDALRAEYREGWSL